MNNEKLTCRAAGGSCNCSNSDAITCPVPDSPTSASVPVASIDTPDFRLVVKPEVIGLIRFRQAVTHIDDHAAQRYETGYYAGKLEMTTELADQYAATLAGKEAAEASLARLVNVLKDIADACNCCGDHAELAEIAADALALLPAKAEASSPEIPDSCFMCHGTGQYEMPVAIPAGVEPPPAQMVKCNQCATTAPAMGEELPDADEFFKEQLSESGMKKYTEGERISLKAGVWCEIMEDYGRACMAPLQAIIDRLMLEYCPNEMTATQVEEWGKHQRRAPEDAACMALRQPGAENEHKECCDTPNLCSSVRRCTAKDAALVSRPAAQEPFQNRVKPWMLACFGEQIAADKAERNHRFFEESTELVQACGMTASEAHQLVDYVYGRDVGEPYQEVGGVMVTLAALCLAQGMDMHQCGETELARIWTKVEQIRAKQAAKPKHGPLPVAPQSITAPAPTDPAPCEICDGTRVTFGKRCACAGAEAGGHS